MANLIGKWIKRGRENIGIYFLKKSFSDFVQNEYYACFNNIHDGLSLITYDDVAEKHISFFWHKKKAKEKVNFLSSEPENMEENTILFCFGYFSNVLNLSIDLGIECLNRYIKAESDQCFLFHAKYIKSKLLLKKKLSNESLNELSEIHDSFNNARVKCFTGIILEDYFDKDGIHLVYEAYLQNVSSPGCFMELSRLGKKKDIRILPSGFRAEDIVRLFYNFDPNNRIEFFYRKFEDFETHSFFSESFDLEGFGKILKNNKNLFLPDLKFNKSITPEPNRITHKEKEIEEGTSDNFLDGYGGTIDKEYLDNAFDGEVEGYWNID